MISEKTLHKLTASIISMQIALNKAEDLKHTPFYKKEVKMKLNPAIKELIKNEPDFDNFFNNVEDQTTFVYDVYNQYFDAVCKVPIWDASEMTAVIEAFLLDRKSISGIAKKVLKQNGVEVNVKK